MLRLEAGFGGATRGESNALEVLWGATVVWESCPRASRDAAQSYPFEKLVNVSSKWLAKANANAKPTGYPRVRKALAEPGMQCQLAEPS